MTAANKFALLSSRLFLTQFIRKKFLCYSANNFFHMAKKDESKIPMELVKVPPIVSIYRQALRTFDDNFKKDLATNLSRLKGMMNGLRADHLGFDKSMSDARMWRKDGKAPCTYIEVFQNSNINMSIFVLKPGFQMPLHDHPHMHGLLKVISGAVEIRSFTEYPVKEAIKLVDFVGRAKLEAARLAQGMHKRRRFFAEISQNQKSSDTGETCVLTPTVSNYHEIRALEAPAAFFDILSPPYDTLIEEIGPRRCRYYHVLNQISTNLVQLQEMDVPDCFYCDQAPYLGPILQ